MAYATEVLADTPLAYWRLGDSGTAQTDATGNARTLTLTSATGSAFAGLLTGDANGCWDAAGGSYGATASNPTWANVSTWTVELWFQSDGVSGTHSLVNRDNDSPRCWNLYVSSGNLQVDDGLVGILTGGTTLVTGTTYHVVLTYDGNKIRAYLNGVLDGTSANTANAGASVTNPITIGASNAGSAGKLFYFDGRIDEVAYYSGVLSTGRIAAHYAAGATTYGTVTLLAPDTIYDVTAYQATITGVSYGTVTLLDPDPLLTITAYGIGGTLACPPVPTPQTTGQLWPGGT